MNSGKRVEELSIKIDGIDLTFTEKLFKQILGKALFDFHKSNRGEFEVDFVRSEIEILNNGFKAVPTGSLQNPEDRFLPKFVKGCFDFLLNEMPPSENEWNPSEKYYQIIAHLLVESSIVSDQEVDGQTIGKVKYCHSLDINLTNLIISWNNLTKTLDDLVPNTTHWVLDFCSSNKLNDEPEKTKEIPTAEKFQIRSPRDVARVLSGMLLFEKVIRLLEYLFDNS